MAEDTLPSALSQRFVIGERLAAGQSGTSYRAVEKTTQRRGVLKVLTGARSWTAAERGRLVRELEKLTTLRHPCLAEVWASGSADDLPWIFRAEVPGQSLRAKLDTARATGALVEGPFAIAAQVAAALDEVHRSGLLQRDLSPEHVIVQPDGTAVLLDTGIAARIASTSVFEIVGKPAYVSPEHAAGKLVSFRSDLYALGCMLYEMLTGEPPFSGPTEQVLEAHRSKPAPSLEGRAAPAVVALVTQLLQKEPRDRPFSAQQVRRTLEPLAGPLPMLAARPKPAPRADATEQLSALDLAPVAPPVPARPAPRPDGTEQLSALDLARAEALVGAASPAPSSQSMSQPRQSLPPPVPANARRSQPPAPPRPAPPPSQAQVSAQAVQGPSSSELDYDDFAETKAVSRDMVNELRALGGLEAIDPNVAVQGASAAQPGFGGTPAAQGGFAAPAAQGGFGAPAAQGGFGAPAGQGGFAAPAGQGGFGAPAGQGGFGAPAGQGGFGAPAGQGGFAAPAGQGGFAAPAGQGGFGAPAGQGGFGAPAAQGGFGAPAAQGGFGAPAAQGGFGAPAVQGGFGGPASPSSAGGFGAPSSAGGFGAPSSAGGFGASAGGFGATASPAYVPPAEEPKKSRRGLWIALGLVSLCGTSTVALGAAGWFLDIGGMQTQILAAAGPSLGMPTTPIVTPSAPSVAPTVPMMPTTPSVAPSTTPAVAGAATPPTPVTMVRVTVDSNPPGASITINGEPAGRAPVTRDVPRDTMVEARAEMEGYLQSSQSMSAGSDVTMTLTLQPNRSAAAVATVAPTTAPSTTRPPSTSTSTTTTPSTSTSTTTPRPAPTTTTSAATSTTASTTTSSTAPSSSGGLAARIAPSSGGTTATGTTTGTATTASTTGTAAPASGTGAPRLASGLRPSSGGTAPTTTASTATTPPSGGTTSGGTAASSSGGGSVDELRAQAREHFQARRFREAAESYERATRLAPTNVNLWSGLGAARLAAGDNAGAVQAYERAVQLAPTTAAYHAALGRAYAQNGNRDAARREYQRALELDPQNRDAQIGMSRL
ncbi:MAG: hypothetical protein OHK0013_08390 [Sandaracinaceae bacterium]